MSELEAWLIGTPAELDAAARALGRLGPLLQHADRIPLAGTDAGRWRTYARLLVTTAQPHPRTQAPASADTAEARERAVLDPDDELEWS